MDSSSRQGFVVALISLLLLAGLAYVVFLLLSPVFVAEPLTGPAFEKCVFPDNLTCLDWVVSDGEIQLLLLNPSSREMIIRNVSAASAFLEGGLCTTGNLDGRLRRDKELRFSPDKSGTDAYPADSYAAFYADYVASAGFARYAALEAAADYAGSAVVAAVLTAANADGATAGSVAKAARAAASSIRSSIADGPDKARVQASSVAGKIADAVSEAANADNATAASTAEAALEDVGEHVNRPGVGYGGYDSSTGVSDAAKSGPDVVSGVASAAVSSVTKAARAAVADGATPESVAASARDAADEYAAAARADASGASRAASQAAKTAVASYAPYYSSYYADYSRLTAKSAYWIMDSLNSSNALAEAISAEVPAARFEYDNYAAFITARYAVSAAAYDVIPAADADYASYYYTSYTPHFYAYQAIQDVANGSVRNAYNRYYFSGSGDYAAYEAAVEVISADPSAVDAAYEAAINAYYDASPFFDIRDDAYSSYYALAYAAARDVISAAYQAYSGSASLDYSAAVSAFYAASDAVDDYAAVYPDDPISAAVANVAVADALAGAAYAAMSVYPNASTADYVTYATYARDVVDSAYADVRARDAELAVITAEYIAAAVAAASDFNANIAGSPASAKAAAERVINAAQAAANEAVSVAGASASSAEASERSHSFGECAYVRPDNMDGDKVDGKKFWRDPKNQYKIEVTYSWADEPDVNHVIQGELLSSAPPQ